MRVSPEGTVPGQVSEVFGGRIECIPYSEDGELPQVPVVNLHIVDDHWVNGLDPDDLAEVATRFRAQARLDHEMRPQLIATRADWAAHHPAL
ncbi:MAG TPA: hypothetical protein VIW71_08945 [Streptomyces sp.]